ncbi:hypothetical protein ABRY23_10870 [Melioribacteraceae bacterium 4301-Me]|uniref:hypothetical protein n=1 Tax=Pyranulibacter aquaticus TaxID=3163344 RepID=UPI003595694C
MMSNENKLCDEFEKELLLFIDKQLEPVKIKLWEKHISECRFCSNLLNETTTILEESSKIQLDDIEEDKFNVMIKNTLTGKNSLKKFVIYTKTSLHRLKTNKNYNYLKIAFASILVVASIILLLSKNSPPVNNTNNNIMNWDDEEITQQINEIRLTIDDLNNEDYVKYLIQQLTKDKWLPALYSIKGRVEYLQQEIKKPTL